MPAQPHLRVLSRIGEAIAVSSGEFAAARDQKN
jgi:hypothetical protein